MPAEAVAITGGSILGLLLGGTAECRCTSRLIGSFRPSVRRNAKPRWSWSPVRRESCRRVGPATAERRPIVCIVDDSRDLWSSDTSFSDIAEPASPGSCMVDTIRGAALAAPRVHVPLQRAPLQGAWEALRAPHAASVDYRARFVWSRRGSLAVASLTQPRAKRDDSEQAQPESTKPSPVHVKAAAPLALN
jgi:hypothetical protein